MSRDHHEQLTRSGSLPYYRERSVFPSEMLTWPTRPKGSGYRMPMRRSGTCASWRHALPFGPVYVLYSGVVAETWLGNVYHAHSLFPCVSRCFWWSCRSSPLPLLLPPWGLRKHPDLPPQSLMPRHAEERSRHPGREYNHFRRAREGRPRSRCPRCILHERGLAHTRRYRWHANSSTPTTGMARS